MKSANFFIVISGLALVTIALAVEEPGTQNINTAPPVTQPLNAGAIIERSQHAFYYAAGDMKARVAMDLVDRDGGRRMRVLSMLRRDESDLPAVPGGSTAQAGTGNQKYFIYFHEPGDVRRMVFMVWKYPEKEDDRWLFIPALDLIRRIAADDKRSSFVGSDFTYEDISGRDLSSDSHTLLREEKVEQRDCYVIGSTPKAAADYTRRISWIDKKTFLPLREEYFDVQEQLFRVYTADRIENITVGEGGNQTAWPTVTRRTMQNVKTGHRTEVVLTSVTYDLGLKDNDFSERRMRRPPREWLD
jgi:hypothetical protein